MVGQVDSTLPRAMFTSRVRHFHVPRSFLVCVLSLWLSLSAAQALDPSKRLTQYAHTAWQTQDVAEDFHGPFTQTADGYFWFGTATGLVRFDGVKFAPYAPPDLKLPSRGYQYLLGARDGSLWIGTTNGLGRLKDGKFQWYSDPAKHKGTVKIFEDKQGTIWVTRYHLLRGEGPLCRVEGSGLHCYGKNDGIPPRYAFSLTEDSAGDLWFGSNVLYRWRPGSPATAYLNELAHRQDAGQGINDVAIGESGTVWAAIDGVGADLGVRYLSGGKWASYVIPGFDGSKIDATALYIDRNGLLWIGTDSDGIYRVRNGKAEHYGIAEGLSGKLANSFYEDREGNLWVWTDAGLDKFRDIPVITYSTREGLSETSIVTVLGLQDGSLWVGNGNAIDILAHGEHSMLSAKEGLSGGSIGGLYQDHRGVVWLALGGRLMSYEHGRFKEFKRPDGSSIAKGGLGAITEDANHTIWALTAYPELFRVKDQTAYLVISVSGDNRP
jgi:ligand-binding sensor domain-containing protein